MGKYRIVPRETHGAARARARRGRAEDRELARRSRHGDPRSRNAPGGETSSLRECVLGLSFSRSLVSESTCRSSECPSRDSRDRFLLCSAAQQSGARGDRMRRSRRQETCRDRRAVDFSFDFFTWQKYLLALSHLHIAIKCPISGIRCCFMRY